MTTRNAATKAAPKVGDSYELKGHGIVEYPDGTVATASRHVVLGQSGTYKVTYDAKPNGSARVVTFTVAK